jgi:hypothetical protein
MRLFCASVLKQAHWESGRSLVLDGIRHAEAVTAMKALVAPTPFALVYLDVRLATRQERFATKDNRDHRLNELEKHSTEVQVQSIVRSLADLTVDGDRPLVDVVKTVVAWISDWK